MARFTEYLLFTRHAPEPLMSHIVSSIAKCKGRFYDPGFAEEKTQTEGLNNMWYISSG